jgi:hypothetical protein
MEFLIQPLEVGWDLVELSASNGYCPVNNYVQCGCPKNTALGCGDPPPQSASGPQTQ